MSESLEVFFSEKNHEWMVKCGQEGRCCSTSLKQLVAQCSSDVKKELHDYLGMYIVCEKGSRVGYARNKLVELVAASCNISTIDLVKVLEYRAQEMKDKTAEKVMKNIESVEDLTSSDDDSEESQDSTTTNLVWVDGQGDEPRIFCEVEIWDKIEELATMEEMNEVDAKIAAVDNLITECEENAMDEEESLGQRYTRVFIQWAIGLLSQGASHEYPLKLYSDALAFDRYFYHMNESCGSLTHDQYDDFKESVINEYTKKAIEYGLGRRLDVRRCTLQVGPNNMVTRVYEPAD